MPQSKGLTRRAIAGGAMGVGATLLAACGIGAQTDTGPRTITGPKVLSFITFNDISTPEYKECIQVYNERLGGGIQIEGANIPSNELVTKMTALVVSNSLPDVAHGNIALFPALAKVGVYKPIAPFMNKDKSMPAKDFFAGHVQAFTYKGELMGLTGGLVDQNIIFVNKRVFDAGGVKVPTPAETQNWTWDRITDIAKRLTKPDGTQYGLTVNQVSVPAFSGGAYWVNDRANATRGALDDPRWARAMEMWVDWTQRQKVVPLVARDLGEANMTDAWARGRIAMLQNQSPQIRFSLIAEPSLQWDMIWVPKLANDQPRKFFASGAGWGMTPQARNQDLAWEWVKFMDRKPGSYEISLKHNPPQAIYVSSHIPTTQKELKRLKEMGVANADLLVAGSNDLYWPPLHTEWSRIESTIVAPELARIQNGTAPVNSTLRELNERVTRELQLVS